jgi:hypothetical protein
VDLEAIAAISHPNLGPSGHPVTITTEVVAPFDGRTVSFVHTFAGAYPSFPLKSASTLRFLNAHELTQMLGDSGLRIARQFGDFQGGRLDCTSPEIVTIAVA